VTYQCKRFLLVTCPEKVTKTTVTVLLERIIRDRRRSQAVVKGVSPQRGDGGSLWWEERRRKSGVTCGGSEVGRCARSCSHIRFRLVSSLSSVPRCSIRSLVCRVFARGGKRDRESQGKAEKRTREREIECRSERRVYERERERRRGSGGERERERERGRECVYVCVRERTRAREKEREREGERKSE